MTRQRFCPICDRAFTDGEAVLRCRECSVLHHPTCWVRNEGCSAGCETTEMPEPLAYDLPSAQGPGIRPPRPVSGIPAASRSGRVEGLRDPVERVIPVERAGDDQEYDGDVEEDETAAEQPGGIGRWIGRPRPNAEGRSPAPVVVEPPQRAQRGRYAAADRRTPPVEDMRLYRRGGVLRYWYVPIAAILAIAVAIGVVWAADQFIGGTDETPAANGEPEPTPGDDENGQPQPTPTPEGTPTPEATPTLAPGELGIGVSGVVSGTGTGGFLNIRVGPGTENDIIDAVPDGTPFTIVGGPQQSGNFTWWEVEVRQIVGWAAQDFLSAEGATEEGTTE